MASTLCWRCQLPLRSSKSAKSVPLIAISLFHWTTPQRALPPKKSNNAPNTPKYRESRSAHIKKKAPRDKAGPPAIGERKALRKRIVLSNTNALEIPEMQKLTAENIADTELHGQMMALPGPLLDQLRAAEAFKTTQGWGMFRRPSVLMRKESVEMGSLFAMIEENEKGPRSTVRRIVTGARGTGKSLFLLQAMAMAFLKGWVVIHIPEAQDFTIGHSSYAPLPNTSPQEYIQKHLCSALLSRISKANNAVLSSLTLSLPHRSVPTSLQQNMSLSRLADLGASDPELAWPIFNTLWAELTSPTPPQSSPGSTVQRRPPLLITIDGLAHWMQLSQYRSADFQPIHAHDLSLVRHFLSPLSSSSSSNQLPNGGIILAATSGSNSPTIPSFSIALAQLSARVNAGISPSSPDFPMPDPYMRIDERVMNLFSGRNSKGLELQELKGLSKDEARGLMEYFARSGVVRERVTETWVGEKRSLASGGVVGELERLGRRTRM